MSDSTFLDAPSRYLPPPFGRGSKAIPSGKAVGDVFDIQLGDEWYYSGANVVQVSQNDLTWMSPKTWASEFLQVAAFAPSELAALRNEITTLKSIIEQLVSRRNIIVTITTLYPDPFRLLRDLPVNLEIDEDDCVATWYEANISASAESEGDAIAYFKAQLVSAFVLFESTPESEMGPLPLRQWSVLRQSIARDQ
jgi:hypothetical protein